MMPKEVDGGQTYKRAPEVFLKCRMRCVMMLEGADDGQTYEKALEVIFGVRNKAGAVLTFRLLRLPRPDVIYVCQAMLLSALHQPALIHTPPVS